MNCSVCGSLPAVQVHGTYWLCGPCVLERIEPQQTTTQDPRPTPPWERRELMPYMTLNELARKFEEQKYETELTEWEARNK